MPQTAADRVAVLLQQQREMAAFAQMVADQPPLDALLQRACETVSRYLGPPMAKVLQRLSNDDAIIRTGCGLHPGTVGRKIVLKPHTAEAFALAADATVRTSDVVADDRFSQSDLLREHDIRAFLNVPIPGSGDGSFGVLEVDATEARQFSEDDEVFLRAFANLIGAFIQRETATQQERATVAERDRLLAELQHRTKNDLSVVTSLLMIQAQRSDLPDVRKELQAVLRRVETLRLVYEKLHQSREHGYLDLAAYLSDLVRDLVRFHRAEGLRVRVVTELDPLNVGAEHAVPVGLIVNEFITNSFKYAFQSGRGILHVALDDIDGTARLTLKDNGPSLPPGEQSSKGSGLSLIEGLARQIGGSAQWTSDGGASLSVAWLSQSPSVTTR